MLSISVYEHIKKKIIQNEYVSGNAINELSISKELGVSRTPVREAIIMAEKEGLVKRYPKKGTFIRTVDFKMILEIIELRKIIELAIIPTAIHNIPLDEIIEIENELNIIKNAKIFNAHKASITGRQVHILLFKYCENTLLTEMFERLEMQQNLGCNMVHQTVKNAKKFLKDHLLLLKKLKDRNIDGAQCAMLNHLSSYKEVFFNL